VGIAARLAVPVVLPVHRVQVLGHGAAAARDGLKQPRFLLLAVETLERDDVAADLVHQVSQQGRWQPLPGRQAGAVLADDSRQRAQVPVAGGHRSAHDGLPPVDYDTSAAAAWASVKRPMAAAPLARSRWESTDRTPSRWR